MTEATEGQRGNTETAAELSAGALVDAADRALIDMFLANRLDRMERAMVETRIVADPEFRREVELTEALRSGMRELARQGEIASVLAPPNLFWNRPPVAVAASIVAGLLAFTSIMLYGRLEQTRQELISATTTPVHSELAAPIRTETLLFQQTRGANGEPNVSWRRPATPTMVELRFDVGPEPAVGYTVVIERVSSQDNVIMLAVPYLGTDPSGEIVINVHSAILHTGDYQIRLKPQSIAGLEHQQVTYLMRAID